MDILLALTKHGNNLRVIVVPPSVYEQTSERVKSYLEKVRVSLEKGKERAGRPVKYTNEDVRKIMKLKKQGIPVTEISRELSIPRRTIYYLLETKK